MQRNEKASWEKDFMDFLVVDSAPVPDAVSKNILTTIEDELHPSALKVFGKILNFN